METKLISVDFTFTRKLPDGTLTTFYGSFGGPDYGWNQWGESTGILGDNIPVIDALADAIEGFFESEAEHKCSCWGDGFCSGYEDGNTDAEHPQQTLKCEGCHNCADPCPEIDCPLCAVATQ